MTITKSRPSDLITIKLDSNQTVVTWSMFGTNNFIAKAFGRFNSMDKMVGGQFEKGLTQMKSEVEAAPKQ